MNGFGMYIIIDYRYISSYNVKRKHKGAMAFHILFTRNIILCMDYDVALRLEKIESQKQ